MRGTRLSVALRLWTVALCSCVVSFWIGWEAGQLDATRTHLIAATCGFVSVLCALAGTYVWWVWRAHIKVVAKVIAEVLGSTSEGETPVSTGQLIDSFTRTSDAFCPFGSQTGSMFDSHEWVAVGPELSTCRQCGTKCCSDYYHAHLEPNQKPVEWQDYDS